MLTRTEGNEVSWSWQAADLGISTCVHVVWYRR